MGQEKKPEVEEKKKPGGRSFRKEFALFLILFFLIWLLSYLLTRRLPGAVDGFNVVVAREVAWFLDLLGYRHTMDGSILTFYTAHGGQRMEVIPECTGLYTTFIYVAIIGAFPARIGEKLAGLAIGVPAIHALNLARMVFISLVLIHRPDLFAFFHGYLWQVGFVIFMLLLVIVWMWKVVKPRTGG